MLELIGPLSGELRRDQRLQAFYFGRHNKPDWHLRLVATGGAEWLEGPVRDLLDRRLLTEQERGGLSAFEHVAPAPEPSRYGGDAGLRLAEQVFHHDTLACTELLTAESRGLLEKSRREYCLIMSERYLELLRFTRDERIAFYRYAYAFEFELGRWQDEERQALERRYRAIKDGLLDLLKGDASRDPEQVWGGAAPARIAQGCLEAVASPLGELREAHAAGRIHRSLVDLAWTLTHMHCNRLQVEADAEAMLRFFMHRLHEEEAIA